MFGLQQSCLRTQQFRQEDNKKSASRNTFIDALPHILEVWLGAESNRRHEDFQSSALPTELPSRIALPLSRCIERRVLIKAENARPSTPSCSDGLQALVECCHRSVARHRLDLPLWGKHSCLVFLCGRRERLPYKLPAAQRTPKSRVTLCGSTESRPPREVLPEAALQINGPFEQR
jgi:hypothetical protein